jgi:hypothetical protein
MDAFAELVEYLSAPIVMSVGGDVASAPTNEENGGTGNNVYRVVVHVFMDNLIIRQVVSFLPVFFCIPRTDIQSPH